MDQFTKEITVTLILNLYVPNNLKILQEIKSSKRRN